MQSTSVRVSPTLWLVRSTLPVLASAPLPPITHRIFVCDASGSMSGDLPTLRRHLKGGMAKVMHAHDTATIVWFSGKGQFGIVAEAASVRDAADLQAMSDAIDRYMRPTGLTGFLEPLQEVRRIVKRLNSINPEAAFSLTFMSDGYDNQWSRVEIMKAVEELAPGLSASTVVEYGWYANRPLLVSMAEALGGTYVFAKDSGDFLPILDASMSGNVAGVARREVELAGTPLHGVVFAPSDTGLTTWAPDASGKVRVSANIPSLYMLSTSPVGETLALGDPRQADEDLVTGLYAAAVAMSQRMLSDEVLAVLSALGDVRLIELFAACFGKQQYSIFREEAMRAASVTEQRWQAGYDPKAVPADDSYTVLELLSDLSSDEGNKLRTDSPLWDYSPIGRKTVFGGDVLKEETREALADAIAAASRTGDLDAISDAVKAAQAGAVKEYAFTRTVENGTPMTNLVMHESRPNISIQTRQEGFLELGADGPVHGLPERVPGHVFRNYAVVRDGILNVETLPLSLSEETHALLKNHNMVKEIWQKDRVYAVSILGLPIINRRMVKSAVSGARTLFSLEWELLKAQAASKVYKEFENRHAPRSRSQGMEGLYGVDAAAWLKDIGLTDGGWNPKRVVSEVTDVYIGRELKVSIKGMSSLPPVAKVEEAMDQSKKPLTVSQAIMAPYIREVSALVAKGGLYLEETLRAMSKHWLLETRGINARLAEIKFAVVVGQVWFKEFESLDEGSLDMTSNDGDKFFATATLREMEVKI